MTYLVRILALVSMSSMLTMSASAKTIIESVPFTITKAGTYVLDGDLTLSGTNQTGITVNASNVVIDLAGFTLTTSDTTLANFGITVSSTATNVTIQNGTITGFGAGVRLLGAQELAQNLRLLSAGTGVYAASSCTASVVQNCFIAGPGNNNGVLLDGCRDVVVKNNQILFEVTGGNSAGNNSFIANYIGNCQVGLSMSATDKYQANVTNTCETPFVGGTAVGDENN
jgi:nitrous oxidase accessory protein NosD